VTQLNERDERIRNRKMMEKYSTCLTYLRVVLVKLGVLSLSAAPHFGVPSLHLSLHFYITPLSSQGKLSKGHQYPQVSVEEGCGGGDVDKSAVCSLGPEPCILC
jgi:hypothetical protein